MMGVIGGLQVFKETSMDELCLKSRILTGYLEMLLEENLNRDKMGDKGHVNIITSKDLNERGCQLSLQFSSSSPEDVKKYISMRGGVVDFRPPDLMRVAPVPLYNSFTDVLKFYNLFKTALETIK
jgi:kynureninase